MEKIPALVRKTPWQLHLVLLLLAAAIAVGFLAPSRVRDQRLNYSGGGGRKPQQQRPG